jgi:uncharacterized protein
MTAANVLLVQGLYGAFGRGEVETLVSACTPDVDWCVGADKAHFPTFGPRSGPAGVRDFFMLVGQTVDFDAFAPREFYSEADRVFVLGSYAVTLKKNRRKVASEWVHVFTIRDGKVAAFREFLDTASIAAAYAD